MPVIRQLWSVVIVLDETRDIGVIFDNRLRRIGEFRYSIRDGDYAMYVDRIKIKLIFVLKSIWF